MLLMQEAAGQENAGKSSDYRVSDYRPGGEVDGGADTDLEALVADIMGAVLSLEYGAVTVSVKGGQVVRLERHEKLRLPNPKRAAQPAP